MLKFLLFILCVTIVSSVTAKYSSAKSGYVFTAPKTLNLGETEKLCLSLHDLEPPVHVNIDLLSPTTGSSNHVLSSVQKTFENETNSCLDLYVNPKILYDHVILRLRLRFDKYPDRKVNTQTEVTIEHDTVKTFIETDKAVYKPGQKVNFRIFNLKHNLKPHTEPISNVWMKNPSEIKVAHWTDVKTENGMVQLSFPLPEESTYGTWKIVVEKTKPAFVQLLEFKVKEYVFPRFLVTIEGPSSVYQKDESSATWKICSRYSYGEPAKGTFLLGCKVFDKYLGVVAEDEIMHEKKIKAGSDGCVNYTIPVRDFKMFDRSHILTYMQANFTETKSGFTETASKRILKKYTRSVINFRGPKYFKHSFPYYGKIQVLNADGSKPASNVTIEVCYQKLKGHESVESSECQSLTTDANGDFDFTIIEYNKNITDIRLIARDFDYTNIWPQSSMDLVSWYSNSSSYLQLTTTSSGSAICGRKTTFNVTYTSPGLEDAKPIDFYYFINSKGRIIESGRIKNTPHKNSRLDVTELYVNHVFGTIPLNDQLSIHRFPLIINITSSNMAPVSELLVYYVRPDGEIVSASVNIDVDICFDNPVKLSWQKKNLPPGSLTKLHLEAAPDSICGVSVVDKSVYHLEPTNIIEPHLLDRVSVYSRFKKIDRSKKNYFTFNDFFSCHEESQITNSSNSGTFSHSVNTFLYLPTKVNANHDFENLRAVMMSNLYLFQPIYDYSGVWIPHCSFYAVFEAEPFENTIPSYPENENTLAGVTSIFTSPKIATSSKTIDPQRVTRSYFPETWIWDLFAIGSQGREDIELRLPDTVTDWIANVVCISKEKGLGIGELSKITAFQPLFLALFVPNNVQRNEHFHINISVFNYMPHSLPVIVKVLTPESLKFVSNSKLVLSFCVQSKSNIFHYYLVSFEKLGYFNITVVAELDISYDAMQKCGSPIISYTKEEVLKPVLVKLEGIPVEVNKTQFLCPKEKESLHWSSWEPKLPALDESKEKVVNDSIEAHIQLISAIPESVPYNIENLMRSTWEYGSDVAIAFAQNLRTIAYVKATKQIISPALQNEILNHILEGYKVLPKDVHTFERSAVFLLEAAFILKMFAQVRDIIKIDNNNFKAISDWIMKQQNESGCLNAEYVYFGYSCIQYGMENIHLYHELEETPAITAYALIAFIESGVQPTPIFLNNTLACLEKINISDTEVSSLTAALVTYVFALLEHPKANLKLQSLLARASTKGENFIWWQDKRFDYDMRLSFQMTSYGLMSLVKIGGEENMIKAFRTARWLTNNAVQKSKSPYENIIILLLEALTKYNLAVRSKNTTDDSVLIVTDYSKQIYEMNDVQLRLELPRVPTNISITPKGNSCVLVQTSLKFNKIDVTKPRAPAILPERKWYSSLLNIFN